MKRVVHVSVTQAQPNDPLPYYDGKAKQEQLLMSGGVSYAIVRPTLMFGRGDILVNNIAWLLRRFPLSPIFGSGDYRLQPVYIGDLARLCVQLARSTENGTRDVAGPEGYTFEALVRLIHVPPALGLAAGRLIGLMVGDVVLTADELRGLMRGKLTSQQQPLGAVRFSRWLHEHVGDLGRGYESELRGTLIGLPRIDISVPRGGVSAIPARAVRQTAIAPLSARMAGMGTLHLVATPIGNLDDITLRALKVLEGADLVAAEDTRHSRKLLQHHGVNASLISYHEHNKTARTDEILRALDSGDVALISDAGTPALSDPGHDLVQRAWAAGHRVSPVPGPSAPVAALVASGLATDRFLYLGYLPRRSKERLELLKSRSRDPWTLVAFEVPHRLRESLADCEEAFGPDRAAAVCRELTKVHEEIVRGELAVLRERFDRVDPRGEVTLVVAGVPETDARWDESTVRAAVAERLAGGNPPSTVAREVARLAGWRRRDVYEMTLEE